MPHRTNRYPDSCRKCGASVDADQGTLQGPPWRTLCQTCLPFPKGAASKRIALKLVGTIVLVVLIDRLNGLFGAYRKACEGITKTRKRDDGSWETTCQIDDAPELIERLTAISGVAVELAPDLQAALQARASRQAADLEAADDRITEIEAALAKRGQALFGYQKTGIPWLAARDRGILADDMGLGKTLQALLAAPATAPILVIGPAVAKGVWAREVGKWRPDLSVFTCKGKKGKRAFRWPSVGEIVVCNYDILPGTIEKGADGKPQHVATLPAELVAACPEGCVVIADEAHAVKSSKAQRSKRFRAIADLARSRGGRTWLLTATPILNRPPELWSLLVAGGLTESFGSWKKFAEAFNGERGRYGYEWGRPTPKAAELLKRVQLRRLKADVLTDLPAKRYQSISVNGLDKATQKACDEALAALESVGVDFEDAEELAERTERSGAAFELLSKARAALATAKIPHLIDLVSGYEEADEPVVVFSAHRAPVDALAQRDGWASITGSTAPEERTRIEDAFQQGKLRGVAATIQAGGVAITLTRASNAIFCDRLFTPSLNVQAEDRIHRIGQQGAVLIVDLVAEHALDERLYEILVEKAALIAGSIDKAKRQADEADDRDLQAAVDAALAAVADQDEDEGLDEAAYQAALQALNAELAARDAARAAKAQEQRWDEIVAQRAENRGIELDGQPKGNGQPQPRHEARNARERWAAEGLVTLAALDPDHAAKQNSIGFNKSDNWLGHQLALRVPGGLTNLEWALAIGLCGKYHRQIGTRPEKGVA